MKTAARRAAVARRAAKAIVAGLGSMLSLATPSAGYYQPPSNNALGALRGDMTRVGGDMKAVIVRERRREEAARKTAS